MGLGAWLRHRIGARSADEMRGIRLAGDDALEVPAPHDLSLLIRALLAMPSGAILYLEGGAHPPEVEAFLRAHQIAPQTQVGPHTIWPRERTYHLPIAAEVIDGLARFAEQCAGPDVCMHLIAYRSREVLVSAPDVPDDPVLINRHLPDDVVERFARRLGFSRADVKPVR